MDNISIEDLDKILKGLEQRLTIHELRAILTSQKDQGKALSPEALGALSRRTVPANIAPLPVVREPAENQFTTPPENPDFEKHTGKHAAKHAVPATAESTMTPAEATDPHREWRDEGRTTQPPSTTEAPAKQEKRTGHDQETTQPPYENPYATTTPPPYTPYNVPAMPKPPVTPTSKTPTRK